MKVLSKSTCRLAAFAFLMVFSGFAQSIAQAPLAGNTYTGLLEVQPLARIQATGGFAVAVRDTDATMGIMNPAYLTEAASRQRLGISFVNHPAGISMFNGNYATKLGKRKQPIVFSLSGLSYGSIKETDATGAQLGTFSGGDYVLSAGLVRQLGKRWHGGISPKVAYSHLAEVNAVVIALDAGVVYQDSAELVHFAALIRNAGVQIDPYYSGERQRLPLDIQLSASRRFPHLPVRLGMTLHNLQRFNIRYNDSTDRIYNPVSLTGVDEDSSRSFFGDKLMRHVAVGAELYFSRNFRLGLGYNHLRRREMRVPVPARNGLAGFSGGFTIRVNRFDISYARTVYHIAGGTNTFTINTALGRF